MDNPSRFLDLTSIAMFDPPWGKRPLGTEEGKQHHRTPTLPGDRMNTLQVW